MSDIMEFTVKRKVLFFAGRASIKLAEQAVSSIGQSLSEVKLEVFKDKEMEPRFTESVRGAYVFLILSTESSESIIEMLLMVDAAKRASAKEIIAVMPYFGYGRQDRKNKSRVSIGSALFIQLMLSAGTTSFLVMDLHSDQTQGVTNFPINHIYASKIFIPYVKNHIDLSNLKIGSTDLGGMKTASFYADKLGVPYVIAGKTREKPGEVESISIFGDVVGCDILLVDDILDSGGTVSAAVDEYIKAGAKSIRMIAVHGIFSGEAIDKINASPIKQIIVSTTLDQAENIAKSSKIIEVEAGGLIGQTMKNIAEDSSITENNILL